MRRDTLKRPVPAAAGSGPRSGSEQKQGEKEDGWSVFRTLMLARSPAILGCEADEIPIVFRALNATRILKVGIYADLIARFPAPNPTLRKHARETRQQQRISERNVEADY